MITYTGVLVTPINIEAPTLFDMAVQLGRAPRFGGATTRYWPVILHLLICERLMFYMHPQFLPRLYALIHDGHEAITCDVPSTWKTDELRKRQWDLDLRIYRKLHVPMPDQEIEDWVAAVDQASVVAEGALYGPPGIKEWFGVEPMGLALDVVHEIGGRFKTAYDCDGPMAPAVREFMTIANYLMDGWRSTLNGNSSWIRKPKGQDSGIGGSTGDERGKGR